MKKTKDDELPGTVTITRSMGSREVFRITVTDNASHCIAAEITIAPEVFADALTSRLAPCYFSVNTSGVLGALAEHKTELVPFDYTKHRHPPDTSGENGRTKAVADALAPFEVDGWRAYVPDLWNDHRREGTFQRVAFHRHVRDGVPLQKGTP